MTNVLTIDPGSCPYCGHRAHGLLACLSCDCNPFRPIERRGREIEQLQNALAEIRRLHAEIAKRLREQDID